MRKEKAAAQLCGPPHGFRKLASTMLAESGCTTYEIAAITGHRTVAMVAFYTQSVDQKHLAQTAIRRVTIVWENRDKVNGPISCGMTCVVRQG